MPFIPGTLKQPLLRATAVYMIASLESSEAIKILLGQTDQLLRNKLLMLDLAHNVFDTLQLS